MAGILAEIHGDEIMKPSQALMIVTNAAEQARLSLQEHQQVQTAIVVLRDVVFPKPPIKEDKKPDDKPKA